MVKNILFILSCIITLHVQAQSDTVFVRYADDYINDQPLYQTDTLIFPSLLSRNFLIGTTVLPWTDNQMGAKAFGYDLMDVHDLPCSSRGEEVYSGVDHINAIRKTDSTLEVDVTIYANCCHNFLCDLSVDSTGVMHLIYTGYGNYCACMCCFGLTYVMRYDDYGWVGADAIEKVVAIMVNNEVTSKKAFSQK